MLPLLQGKVGDVVVAVLVRRGEILGWCPEKWHQAFYTFTVPCLHHFVHYPFHRVHYIANFFGGHIPLDKLLVMDQDFVL